MRRFELVAGPEPAPQARRLGELPVGAAVITGGGNLRAQVLVHAIVRSVDEPVPENSLRRALQNGPRRRAGWGIERVEVPALRTGGGNLRAQFLVHAIVRSMDEPVSENSVRRALQNGLRRLSEWAIESVAMPPLGTGAGNLDAEDSARTMVVTLLEHMRDAAHPSEVEIRVESEYEREAFERALTMHGNASPAADTQ